MYQLKPDELTDDFFKALKERFGGKEVKITVEERPLDETDYLLQDEENRRILLERIAAVKEGKVKHTLTLEEIEAMAQ
ncbi:MAG: hypothetical protein LBH43_13820 [Treponema sp.]|nr:hypothetical protein [Treponema sp.]